MLKGILYCVSVGFLMTVALPAHAEGALRERIKDRMQERLAEKLGDRVGSKRETAGLSDVKSPISRPGDYTYAILHNGLTRKYLVHVPPSYNPNKSTPLLVAFHGGGGRIEHMAKDKFYGLISKSNKEGFIVVFPNGYSKFDKGILATWNAGECCGDARDKKIDDVGFVRQMVANLTSQMNIDRHRIYATGMSNGGMMSYVVAGKDAFKDTSKVTEFTSVSETVSKWVTYNHCQGAPQRVLSVKGAYCDLYSDCQNETQVKLCVTDTGGHSWPGGYKPQGAPTSQAISANDVMWDYFQNQQ